MQRNTNTLGMLCAVCTISLLSPVTKMAFAQENPAAIVKFVDTAGNVVDGVDAFHCYQAKSTRLVISDGQAKLPAAGGIVVATKDGFEYCGTILNDSERNSVTMLRPGEQPRTYTTLPNPVSKKLKDDLIKQISDDYWKRITDNPKDIRTTMQAMKVLTRVSPEKVEEFLNNNDVPVPVKQSTTNLLLRSYAKSDFPAAIEMADSFTEPMFRSMAFNLLLTVSDPTQAELAAVEKQLIDTAKSIKQPAYRLVTWAVLARHYKRTGRRKQAKRIIDQHLEEAKKLPSDGWAAYPKSLFAALVVAENPELGKEMIDGVDGNEKTRATGRLAFHCCRTRPKLAVELLDTIEAPENSVMAFVHHIKFAGE